MSNIAHCELMDLTGVSWDKLPKEEKYSIIKNIENMDLLGPDDSLYGFIGTISSNNIIGGYFTMQFPKHITTYKRDKSQINDLANPSEQILFVFLPDYGKILIQNKRFQLLAISMETAISKIKIALNEALLNFNYGKILEISPSSSIVSNEELQSIFKYSKQVTRIKINNPNAENIPQNFVYYNPQYDRNKIIRESRINDYPKVKSIDIRGKYNNDLKETHLAKDLVFSVPGNQDFVLEYEENEEIISETNQKNKKTLRRTKRTKFVFSLSNDKKLTTKELLLILKTLSKETLLSITKSSNTITDSQQPGLFK